MLLSITIFAFIIRFHIGKKAKNILHMKIDKNLNLVQELFNFISYSEYFEDLILFCIFYDVINGFYIDIGANDPNEGSVTKAFYLRGWYGINIEPLSNKYKALEENRKRDINLQIGIGKIEGNESFYERGAVSTFHKQYLKGKMANITKIKVTTMLNLCKKYIPKNEVIQFCKIDVEGGEENVLLGNDFEKYRPKVFCIESTFPCTFIPSHDLWEYILLKNDYSFAYQYKVNRFYIDNRINGLRERFILAEKAVKIFEKKKK